jgi:hypothetical protein
MSVRISPAIVAEADALEPSARALFDAEIGRRAKSTGWGFLLALFGLHYAYLGRWGLLVAYWATMGGIGLWWFADLFRVAWLVRDANTDVAVAVLRDVRAVRG